MIYAHGWKQSCGNYVRHCWGTTPARQTKEPTGVEGTGGTEGPGRGAGGQQQNQAEQRADAPSRHQHPTPPPKNDADHMSFTTHATGQQKIVTPVN